MRHYTACALHLSGGTRWVLWYTNDVDGVLLDGDGRIAALRSLEQARAFAAAKGLDLAEEVVEYEVARAARWAEDPQPATIDCQTLLNMYNLLLDVASSLGVVLLADGPEAHVAYDKLFWGCNLSAVTPPGEHWDPTWCTADVEALARVLGTGLMLLQERLGEAAGG
jgi:hypothetical protein